MKHTAASPTASFLSVFYSPLERIDSSSNWAKAFGFLAGAYQYIRNDAFLSALVLVALIGVVDYVLGIKAARSKGIPWNRDVAYRGAMGKISGLILLGLLRTVEHWLYLQAIVPHTRGMFATAIAISLVAIDLQSIAQHRETFGAQPIPVLGAFLAWLQSVASSLASAIMSAKSPPDPSPPAPPAEEPRS